MSKKAKKKKKKMSIDGSIVGDYNWLKGGSMEKYSQDSSLRQDGTATYNEKQETSSEVWERSGFGKWRVEDDTVWIILAGERTQENLIFCLELKKDTKIKKKT